MFLHERADVRHSIQLVPYVPPDRGWRGLSWMQCGQCEGPSQLHVSQLLASLKAISNPPAKNKPIARVLVVEDDLTVGAMMQITLSRSLIDATILATGEDALERLATETYDLILLDIHLPGMSGLDVCRQLKADPRHLRVPVIFVSGETDAARREEAMRLGAVDFIEKPFNYLPFLSCIMGHLKLKANADRDRSAGWSLLRT